MSIMPRYTYEIMTEDQMAQKVTDEGDFFQPIGDSGFCAVIELDSVPGTFGVLVFENKTPVVGLLFLDALEKEKVIPAHSVPLHKIPFGSEDYLVLEAIVGSDRINHFQRY